MAGRMNLATGIEVFYNIAIMADCEGRGGKNKLLFHLLCGDPRIDIS